MNTPEEQKKFLCPTCNKEIDFYEHTTLTTENGNVYHWGCEPEEQKNWKLRLKAIIGDLEVADDFLPDKETIMFLSLSDFVTELLSSVKKQKDEEIRKKIENLIDNPISFIGTGGGQPFPDEIDAYNAAIKEVLWLLNQSEEK